MSQAFDPVLCEAQDQEWSNHMLQSAQLFASAQQNHDAQTVIESFRMQITMLQGQVYEADHAHVVTQLKLEMGVGVVTPKC
jgi:hypothetical protein